MAVLDLTCALTVNDRTRPLLGGKLQPEALRVEITTADPGEIFYRQLKFEEFDVSEMSIASLMIATSKGPTPWVAFPVFTMRRFFHTGLMVRADAGIKTIGDLKGKRIGVPEFQQTAAVWSRGIFKEEFGLDPRDCAWVMERTPETSHGGATGFTPPPGIRLEYAPVEYDLGKMIIEGKIDAIIQWSAHKNIVDRTTVDPMSSPRVKRFFDDPTAEARRYYAKTKVFPINHCCVVRRSLVEQYPWVVLNLYNWFLAGKAKTNAERDALLEPYFTAGVLDRGIKGAVAADPMPYGVQASRPVLETIGRYLHDQGLTSRRVALEEVFHKSTLDV